MNERSHGFTIIHLASAIAIGALVLLALGRSYAATSSLNLESRVHLRANEDLRRNLEAVANVLRSADFDTLTGLSDAGPVASLTWASVRGMDREGTELGPQETILWRPTPGAVAEGVRLGSIFHVVDGRQRTLATRVPENSFRAWLDDGVLRLECRGYYVVQGRGLFVVGRTAILPRNGALAHVVKD